MISIFVPPLAARSKFAHELTFLPLVVRKLRLYGSTHFARLPLVKESNHPERVPPKAERVEGSPCSGNEYHGLARGWIPIPEGSIEDRKTINQGPRACPWGSSSYFYLIDLDWTLRFGILIIGLCFTKRTKEAN